MPSLIDEVAKKELNLDFYIPFQLSFVVAGFELGWPWYVTFSPSIFTVLITVLFLVLVNWWTK